jgi:pentatricopeptide repeat protein
VERGKRHWNPFDKCNRKVCICHVTFVGVLNACASLAALEEGRHAHGQIIESCCETDVFVGSSFVDMYAKCGSMEDACRVFNNMPSQIAVSRAAMIFGHVKCGEGQKVLQVYQQMQMQQEGVHPDPATFIRVLNACASVFFNCTEGKEVSRNDA